MSARKARAASAHLVEEENELDVFEELILAYLLPERIRVLEPVHARVLREHLVERAHGREEDDRVAVVEVREPCRAL